MQHMHPPACINACVHTSVLHTSPKGCNVFVLDRCMLQSNRNSAHLRVLLYLSLLQEIASTLGMNCERPT